MQLGGGVGSSAAWRLGAAVARHRSRSCMVARIGRRLFALDRAGHAGRPAARGRRRGDRARRASACSTRSSCSSCSPRSARCCSTATRPDDGWPRGPRSASTPGEDLGDGPAARRALVAARGRPCCSAWRSAPSGRRCTSSRCSACSRVAWDVTARRARRGAALVARGRSCKDGVVAGVLDGRHRARRLRRHVVVVVRAPGGLRAAVGRAEPGPGRPVAAAGAAVALEVPPGHVGVPQRRWRRRALLRGAPARLDRAVAPDVVLLPDRGLGADRSGGAGRVRRGRAARRPSRRSATRCSGGARRPRSLRRASVWLFRYRDWRAGAVLSGIVAGWLPWFAYAHRTIFTFYSIAFAPWVVLTLVYVLGLRGRADGRATRASRRWAIVGRAAVLVALVVAVSAFFYPVWTAWVVPYDFWHSHMWLPRPGSEAGPASAGAPVHLRARVPGQPEAVPERAPAGRPGRGSRPSRAAPARTTRPRRPRPAAAAASA